MAKVVSLHSFKEKQAAARGFLNWRKTFGEHFDVHTKVTDLSDQTLAFMLRPDIRAQTLIYDLIMGVLGLGTGTRFFYLEGDDKMRVLDISLFLVDQLRFECMRRLGWLRDFAGEKYSLLELIVDFARIKESFTPRFPTVLESMPDYEEYQKVYHGDREMFVRKQIPRAVDQFTRKHLKDA